MSRNSMILPFFHPKFYIILNQLIHVKPDMHHKEDKNNQVLRVSLLVSSLKLTDLMQQDILKGKSPV